MKTYNKYLESNFLRNFNRVDYNQSHNNMEWIKQLTVTFHLIIWLRRPGSQTALASSILHFSFSSFCKAARTACNSIEDYSWRTAPTKDLQHKRKQNKTHLSRALNFSQGNGLIHYISGWACMCWWHFVLSHNIFQCNNCSLLHQRLNPALQELYLQIS